KQDEELVEQMTGRTLALFPRCTPREARAIAAHTATRGSGRAGDYRGRSIAGLRPKNPQGTNGKPAVWTGMTGQSSGRGLWVMPMVYHMTTSWLWRVRLAAAQRGRPSPPRLWLG